MISKEDIKHIASLARLSLVEAEVADFAEALSLFLDQAVNLQKVEVEAVEFFSFAEPKNVVRVDEVRQVKEDTAQLIPKTKEGYLKVKSIF